MEINEKKKCNRSIENDRKPLCLHNFTYVFDKIEQLTK